MAGLVLDGRQIAEATDGVSNILERYFPNTTTRPQELHYGDIINRRLAWSELSQDKRKEASDDVFELILNISPVLMGTAVLKERLKTRYGDSAISPARYGLQATFSRFDKHLAAAGVLGDIVLDSAGIEGDSNVMDLVGSIRRDGSRMGSRREQGRLDSHLAQIDNVRCVDSKEDRGIQLADFIAYVTRAKFERDQTRRFDQIERLWRKHGNMKEPCILPSWG